MLRKILFLAIITISLNTIVLAQDIQEGLVPINQDVTNETVETVPLTEQEKKQIEIDRLNEEMGLGEQKTIVIDDIKTTPNDNKILTKKVVPDTKSELTKMIKMFLKVMMAVALSSVVIFVLLLFVRRFYAKGVTLEDLSSNDERRISLETPQNQSEALKTFLNKTKEL